MECKNCHNEVDPTNPEEINCWWCGLPLKVMFPEMYATKPFNSGETVHDIEDPYTQYDLFEQDEEIDYDC